MKKAIAEVGIPTENDKEVKNILRVICGLHFRENNLKDTVDKFVDALIEADSEKYEIEKILTMDLDY